MPKRQFITSDKLLPVREQFTYSHGIKVGNTIYLSGQIARDRDGKVAHKRDFMGQFEMALENIKNVLETAGASMQDIVKMTFYCRHLWDLTKMMPVYKKYFGDHVPAMTAVEIIQLWDPHLLIEVEAIAVVGEEQTIIGE